MPKPGESKEVKLLYPDEAKTFLDSNKEGTYTLLDVRQPFEYEEAHLPGSRLIPLPTLADSLESLNPQQPILVYCAVGGRSSMAAQLLVNQGFESVYMLQGGLDAWEEPTASSPVGFHLQYVTGDESPRRVIGTAYRMEEGLKRFHEEIRSRTADADLRHLLGQLVKAEEGHQLTLLKLLEKVAPGEGEEGPDKGPLEVSEESLIEGGIDVTDLLRRNEPHLLTVAGYLEVTMMIETQALDLYLRMADESRNPVTKDILRQIGEEEKGHLRMLGQFLDDRSRGQSV